MKAHSDLTEKTLEEYIEDSLLNSKNSEYVSGNSKDYDEDYAFDTVQLFKFLENSQPKKIEKLKKVYSTNFRDKILKRISQELNQRGMIDVLRHGINDRGIKLDLVYFKPNSKLNQELTDLYNKNILSITRQLYYSNKNEKSLDIAIFLNGLPLIAIELKNQFTGQNVFHAIKQFKEDRDPRELLFQYKKRILVYFAVDTSDIYMTTRLLKNKTYFLPFNKGDNGGKGNPPVYEGVKTSYLWEDILTKESLLDIIKRFFYIQEEEEVLDNGDKRIKETPIFPRYHQLSVVREIEKDVLKHGTGQNYLIQHSAGSGKTNSISWLSHRLANLHNEQDENIFDTVIVITDRKVLDNQLQKAVYQLEHKHGVVQKIDKDSTQLAKSMKDGTKIIISTLQKFPFILKKIDELKRRTYAVIIDEAHSSTAGENMSSLKEALAGKTLEEAKQLQQEKESLEVDVNDKIADIVSKIANRDKISFFAFTATPKAKTLELFGRIGEDGTPHEFHNYSMRQAIEEGFILDVLKNYMTYQAYYNVKKKIEGNPEFDKRKASKEITRFVSLHPYNISQKVKIIIEDFKQNRQDWLNGKAKAMIVTASRKHAVRYYLALKEYIKKKGYHIKPLVAFSGSVEDEGEEYTEKGLNGFKETELPKKFKSDEYSILIVAEKYQTGFDEPLLSVMYVDKKLSDVKAVQTLSRLNRTRKGKEETFVLDFVNDAEDIKKAFSPYFQRTEVEEEFDPNLIYDFYNKLDASGIYLENEIERCNIIFFSKKSEKLTKRNLEVMNNIIDQAVERYKNNLTEEEQEEFKAHAVKFTRLYNFVVLVASIEDIMLHKLYIYLAHLIKKLPKELNGKKVDLDDKIELNFFKLRRTLGHENKGEDISLSVAEDTEKLMSPTFAGGGVKKEEEKDALENIIERLNEKFNTDFDIKADALSLKQMEADFNKDEMLIKQANVNSFSDFMLSFKDKFMPVTIDRRESNENFFMKILTDERFQNVILEGLGKVVYESMRGKQKRERVGVDLG